MTFNPHATQAIEMAGTPLVSATGAIILLHGRGGSADDILGLGQAISPTGWAILAPEAANNTWYPYSFLAPREQNEPYLSSALEQVKLAVNTALQAGIPAEKIAVAGFSQGACLSSEFVGRTPRRYGALLAFTGGLIGPLDIPITLAGDLAGTPVLISAGDPDPHVPWSRVEQTAELLSQIGGAVSLQRYPGKPHSVHPEEVRLAREILSRV